jgi:hypothetical protein
MMTTPNTNTTTTATTNYEVTMYQTASYALTVTVSATSEQDAIETATFQGSGDLGVLVDVEAGDVVVKASGTTTTDPEAITATELDLVIRELALAALEDGACDRLDISEETEAAVRSSLQ